MHYERAPRFKRSKLEMAASATGWSEPIPRRELHSLEPSAFHGALLRQLRFVHLILILVGAFHTTDASLGNMS